MNFCFLGAIGRNVHNPHIHHGVFDLFAPLVNFFNMSLVGVALGNAQILTKFMVKQTEFAVVLFFFSTQNCFFSVGLRKKMFPICFIC